MTAQATSRGDARAERAPQRPPARRPPRRRRSLVRTIATYLGIAILFVVVAVTTFLIVAPPVDIVRERLIAEFQARTGYLLEINGQTTMRLVPGPSIEFRDVVIATPGENGAPVLRVASIEVEPRTAALLRGRIEADKVMIRRPQLDLVVDAEGRRKWIRPPRRERAQLQPSRERAQLQPSRERAHSQPSGEGAAAQSYRVAQLKDGGAAGRFSQPVLRDGEDAAPRDESLRDDVPARPARVGAIPSIRIVDGIVRYRDLRTGQLVQSDQAQLRVAHRSGRDLPLMIGGTLAFGGESVKVQLQTDVAEAARAKRAERVALRLEGRHGTAVYDGSVDLADRLAASGTLDISTKQARDALRWLGFRSRDVTLAGPLAFKGRVDTRGGRTAVDQLDLTLEGLRASGAVTIDHGGAKPRFAADLNFAELDIDRLRAKAEQRSADRASRREQSQDQPAEDGQRRKRSREVRRVERGTEPPPSPAALPAETDAADNDPAHPDPRGPRMWRTEPIPFQTLNGADGEARLKASRVVWRGATLTDAAGSLSLADGAMKVDIREGAMHGGRARGLITASAAGHIAIDLTLDDVNALETLSNSGRFEVLDGPARIRIAVAGQGATEKEIVDTLTGTATIDITKGAIRGWSIDEILASARRLQIPNLQRDANARTPFDRLSAAVVIKDGVATGKDMRIAASPISLDSSGTIDLRARTLDLTLRPRVAGDPATASRFAGLSVPLQLTGPWNRPRLRADYQSVLKSPQKAIDAAREAARDIKDEDIDKAAKRFLGDGPEAEKGAKRAKELLKRFLDR